MAVITQDKITLQSAKAINDKAEAAQTLAGNTNQHFWFTSTGTDTGAHITEVTQEDFVSDPTNGGSNLLARSNGIAIRDGLTELASFDADGIIIGKDEASSMEITQNSITGIMEDGNQSFSIGTQSSENTYTDEIEFANGGFVFGASAFNVSGARITIIHADESTETISGTADSCSWRIQLNADIGTNLTAIKFELGSIPVTSSSTIRYTRADGTHFDQAITASGSNWQHGWIVTTSSTQSDANLKITQIAVDGVQVTFESEQMPTTPAIRVCILRETLESGAKVIYEYQYSSTAGYYTFGNRLQGANSGKNSFALGDGAVGSGQESIAVGEAIAFGKRSIAVGDPSSARYSVASSENSVSVGTGTNAGKKNSVALGEGTLAFTENGVAIGRHNTTETDKPFVIGNGTSGSLSNALTVDWNGNVVASGDITDGSGHTLSNIGKVFSSSRSVAITVANINTYAEGASLTLPAGTYIVHGSFTFNSATGARTTDIDICNVGGSTAASGTGLYARQRVAQGAGNWVRLETSCILVLTAQTPVYVKGSATLTSTAQASEIKAVRIA